MRFILTLISILTFFYAQAQPEAVIRINQLGYVPGAVKVAVLGTLKEQKLKEFTLVNASNIKAVYKGSLGKNFGAFGPFVQSYRLNFSNYKIPGKYYLQSGMYRSPVFNIDKNIYHGAADFALHYMRAQRCGFNPVMNDSCHTGGGYSLYGKNAGIADSSFVPIFGGWHDASDYLQYATTTANATAHLLMAFRDFPNVFGDKFLGNGLSGKNNTADVLDEATWGLQWLHRMFPKPDVMYNQVADDRDHISMRMPALDSQYGRKYQRPVYLNSGEPQQRGKFMNATQGTSSTAAKFASAFALAYQAMPENNAQKINYYKLAMDALHYAEKKQGFTQTASVKSPYIYAEENWEDDMEFGYAAVHQMLGMDGSSGNGWFFGQAVSHAKKERVTPWLGTDTARHYQWYPFVNLGHNEVLRSFSTGKNFPHRGTGMDPVFIQNFGSYYDSIKAFYKAGVEAVWHKAKTNAFYRGVPFIWCSNNLTVAFAQQCYWYRTQTGDKQFAELEQANIDWLFGCNPWGTSMVYGLPANGDTPEDPHAAFTHLGKLPINGALVDGPVYNSIFKNLIGIQLTHADPYAAFQSGLAVYHDDYGDYSTNEPTMDGTASLIYLLAAMEDAAEPASRLAIKDGGIIRGDKTQKKLSLVFTAHEFGEGVPYIKKVLDSAGVKGAFFFTGDFLRNAENSAAIRSLIKSGNYVGAHSDKHLLYADWGNKNLLVNRDSFFKDLKSNYDALRKFGIGKKEAPYFLPPYEWYTDSIGRWTKDFGLTLINNTSGTLSAADYTLPADKNYRSSDVIFKSIVDKSGNTVGGLNGYLLLIHAGTDEKRTDKFYKRLGELIKFLRSENYEIVRLNDLLD